jgi:transposase
VREFAISDDSLEVFFRAVLPHLDERQRRLLAGSVARLVGRGGIAAVAETASMSRSTVQRAVSEIDAGIEVTARVRGPGAGRPKTVDAQPGLLLALDELVEPESRGDPMCPLRWTTKSTRTLAGELARQGYSVSHVTVGELLHEMGYSLQANAKENEGSQHADRDAQFVHLNTEVVQHLSTGQPVISVDAKKKEVVGDLKNAGKTWEPTGKPQRVATHDFPDKEVPKAVPYGVYDLGSNEGFVSVGDSGDTAAFAVETIRRWWDLVGSHAYPDAKRLLSPPMLAARTATASGSGSSSSQSSPAKPASRSRYATSLLERASGTIEHRLWSHVSMNWKGRPLVSHQVVVDLIAATTTRTGLKVKAGLDQSYYPRGTKITDKQLKEVPLRRHDFHGEWNYTVLPR